MINVIITDDHPVVRLGIKQILEDEERIGLIDEAGSGQELLTKMRSQEYNVVLLDISLPGRSGLDLIKNIKKMQRSSSVLILSMHSDEIYIMKAFESGASGYVTKSSSPEELVKAIFKVAGGEKYLSSHLSEQIAEHIIINKEKPPHHKLSPREIEVLALIGEGNSMTEIAGKLSLSPKTISTYRERLLKKLAVKNTAGLIKYAIIEGLVRHI
ncbi:MAG: response regulator transcription factor [Bacteroidota bacterium]